MKKTTLGDYPLATTLITNARILSGGRELSATSLLVHNGYIQTIGGTALEASTESKIDRVIDLEGRYITPGLIDIQLNGGYQSYLSLTPDAKTLQEMTDACLEFGTPYFYPTLISSPIEVIFEAIEVVREAMKHNPHILGMHLEGPFLNVKRKGAHNAKVIHRPDTAVLREIITKGSGVIRMITVAPEELTDEQIDMLLASDIQVSLGHSDCSYEEAMALFDRGANIITHLYNAMSPFTHRAPGLVGAALEHSTVYTPLILDGRHCHWASARTAYQMKGERFILITDAAVLGRRMKEMAWEGLHAILTPEGYYVNPNGNLAGSAISLPEAIQNAMTHLGVTFAEAVDMCTGRVARAIGMSDEIGYIAPRHRAMFSVFSSDTQQVEVLNLA